MVMNWFASITLIQTNTFVFKNSLDWGIFASQVSDSLTLVNYAFQWVNLSLLLHHIMYGTFSLVGLKFLNPCTVHVNFIMYNINVHILFKNAGIKSASSNYDHLYKVPIYKTANINLPILHNQFENSYWILPIKTFRIEFGSILFWKTL